MKSPIYFYCLCFIICLFLVQSCSTPSASQTKTGDAPSHRLLLRDEGLSQLSYLNLPDSTKNWHIPVPAGRDIQLVGGGRLLIGTGDGYEERDLLTGAKLHELSSFKGTVAARRLRNGNTLLVGANWQDKQGIVLVEVNGNGQTQRTIVYPGFSYVRLVRETISGTFLITADETIFEGKSDGTIIWRAKVVGRDKPHAWQALRLANGQTIVSTGFAANFQLFGGDGKLVDSIVGPVDVKPHFFAGFQVLANGNYMVTNWQGHGPKFGSVGVQLLEFNAAGKLVWSWKQDPARFSSLQGVLVLDGLDPNFLHVEDASGKLVPVK